MKNHLRTKKKGGGPKRKTAKNPAATAAASGSTTASPEKCPICMENLPKNAPKTTCGHRFHKKCLMGWCKTHPLEPTCPNCREPIPEDCDKMQPGQSMPPSQIDRIMRTEEYAHNLYKIDVGGDILEKKRALLLLLKFPRTDLSKIHHFSEAVHKSTNYETARDILTLRYQRRQQRREDEEIAAGEEEV